MTKSVGWFWGQSYVCSRGLCGKPTHVEIYSGLGSKKIVLFVITWRKICGQYLLEMSLWGIWDSCNSRTLFLCLLLINVLMAWFVLAELDKLLGGGWRIIKPCVWNSWPRSHSRRKCLFCFGWTCQLLEWLIVEKGVRLTRDLSNNLNAGEDLASSAKQPRAWRRELLTQRLLLPLLVGCWISLLTSGNEDQGYNWDPGVRGLKSLLVGLQ